MLNFLASATDTFGRNHFIMLGISIILIIAAIIYIKKSNISFEKITVIMLLIWVICESLKIIGSMKYVIQNGDSVTTEYILSYAAKSGDVIVRAFLPRGDLPFHLCSIQPFFILVYKFSNNKKLKDTILQFIFPTALIGTVFSLALDTVGADFTNPKTYEYFFFHAFLFVYAVSIVIKKATIINTKSCFKSILMVLIMFICSIWINTILSDTNVASGSSRYYTNFFYSSKPPLSGLPFLNLNHGWFVYIFHIMSLGAVLVMLVHIPFIINEKKEKKLIKEQ